MTSAPRPPSAEHAERMAEFRHRWGPEGWNKCLSCGTFRFPSIEDATCSGRVSELAAYADQLASDRSRLEAELEAKEMQRLVFEEKLNEYIDKTKEAARKLRDATHGHHGTRHELDRVRAELAKEREGRRNADALIATVRMMAETGAELPYYNSKTKDDAGSDWRWQLESIVETIDKETKEGHRVGREGSTSSPTPPAPTEPPSR